MTASPAPAAATEAAIVDLSWPVENGMPRYPVPWHAEVEMVRLARHEVEGRETRRCVLGTHTGTHCDAPLHFVAGGASIDRIDPALWVGPAVLADFDDAEPGRGLGADDLAARVGPAPPPRVVLRFGWSDRWGTDAYYGAHPWLDETAARWLIDHGVRLLGMDTPMPDDGRPGPATGVDVLPIHRILLGHGVVLVENMANLGAISGLGPSPGAAFELIVAPLPLVGADGAPARCFARPLPEPRP